MKITLSLPNAADETEEVKAWFRHAEKAMAADIDAAAYNLLVYGMHVVSTKTDDGPVTSAGVAE